MVTTIYEDDALRVFYHDRASADVIVTANNFGTINGESYWGRKAIEPLGLSCLGFVAKMTQLVSGTLDRPGNSAPAAASLRGMRRRSGSARAWGPISCPKMAPR